MKTQINQIIRKITSTCLVLLASLAISHAGNDTWTGSADAIWADANWTPAIPGFADTAIFNSAGNAHTTIDLGSGVTVSNVLFDTALAAPYTIGAGAIGSQTLTISDGGSVQVTATDANNQLFDANIVLGAAGNAANYGFTNSSASTLTFAGQILSGAGGTAGIKTLTLAGPVTISGDVTNSGTLAFVTPTLLGLTIASSGNVTLTGTNCFDGPLNINGTLTIGGSGLLGSNFIYVNALSNIYSSAITNNGIYNYNSSANDTNSGIISGTGALNVNGPGTLTLSSAPNLFSGATTVNGGILAITASSGGNGSLQNSAITVNAGGELDLLASDSLGYNINLPITISGIVKKTNDNQSETLGRPIIMSGGTLTSANNTGELYNLFGNTTGTQTNYIQTTPGTANFISGTGQFGINTPGVYFNVGSSSTLTISCTLDQKTAGAPLIQLGPGTLILTGTNTLTSGMIISNGTIAINLTGVVGNGNYPGPITNYANLNFNSSANQVFTGAITNNGAITFNSTGRQTLLGPLSGTGSLTQSGSGTVALYGSNTFTGLATVTAGTLLVNASQAGTSAVTVNDGATLGVTPFEALPAQFAPSTLTVGSVNGTTVQVTLTSTTVVPLNVGTLVLVGANNTFNVAPSSALAAGSYPILSYTTASLVGSVSGANFAFPANVNATVSSSVNGSVTTWSLVVSSVSAVTPTVWTGAVNGTWDINTTANWSTGKYLDGSAVLFDNTATGSTAITNLAGAGPLSPASVTFNNTSKGYAISNTVVIAGPTGVIMNGAGNVTNLSLNTYTGPTVINTGTFWVGAASVGGTGPLGLQSAVSLGNAASASLNLNGFSTQIGSLSGGGGAGGNVTNGGVTLTLGGDNSSQTYGGVISGTGGLTQVGAGSLTLTNTNTFTGGITMSGTLTLSGAKAQLGSTGNGLYAGTIANNGVFNFNTAANQTNTGVMSGIGSLNVNGFGATVNKLTISNSSTFSGPTSVNGATILVLGNGNSLANSAITVATGSEIDLIGSDALGSGNTNSITIAGIVKKTNSQSETLFRPVTLNNGQLVTTLPAIEQFEMFGGFIQTVASTANNQINGPGLFGLRNAATYFNVANASTLTISTAIEQNSNTNNSPLNKQGPGNLVLTATNTFYGPLVISNGTVTVSGTGDLGGGDFSGNITNYGALNFTSSANQIYSGAIANNGTINLSSSGLQIIAGALTGTGSLTQTGPGTLLLQGANNETGLTTVAGGKLLVNASQPGTGSVTVNDGAILGVTAVGNSQFAPSTLTLGSVNGAGVNVTLSSTTAAPINAGTLNLVGPNNTVVISAGSSFVNGGTYPVLSYTSSTGSGGVSFTLPATLSGSSVALVPGTPNTYVLTVGTVAPQVADIWHGSVNGTWDINTTANWTNINSGGATVNYIDGSPVQFDDTATSFVVTNLVATGPLSPAGIVLNNSAHNYIFSNAVSIAGVRGITKNGTGFATNLGTNSYTGPTVINAGTLVAGAPSSSIGTGGPFGINSAVSLANVAGAALNLNNNSVQIGSLSGGGNLGGNVTNGSGTLTLGGDGTSQLYGGVISGAGGGLTQIGGGSLTLTNTNTFTGPLSLTGTITIGGTLGQLGAGAYGSAITDNGLLNYNSSTNGTFSGVISGDGGLTVNGPGALTLGGQDLYFGQTIVNGGILAFNSGGSTGNVRNSPITINVGGELDLITGDATGYAVTFPITNYGIIKKTNVNQAETLFRPIYLSGGTMTSTSFPGARLYNFFGNFIATLPNSGNSFISGVGTFGLNTAGVYFNVGANSTLTISAVLDPQTATTPLIQTGPGTMILTATNTFTAGILVSNGTVSVGSSGNLNSGRFAGPITNYGTFNYNSSYGQALTGAISNSTTGIFSITGSGGLNVSGAFVNNGVISNNTAASEVFQGAISGPGSVIQNGSGILALFGPNTYTGGTTINAGTLLVNSSQSDTGVVTVNDGGALAVVAVSGATSGFSPSTLSLGSVNGASLQVTLNSTTQAPLTVGTLNLTGAANTVYISAASTLAAGTYPVLGFTTQNGGPLLNAQFILPAGVSGSVALNGSTYVLTVSSVVAQANNIWKGTINGIWDINNTANWSGGVYLDGSPVQFDDTATTFVITNTVGEGSLSPASIVFNNSTHNYDLSNSVSIAGATGITMTGTGNLTNSGVDLYSGPTVINGGDLVVGAPSSGPGPVGYNSAVTLANNAGAALILNGLSTQIGSLAGGGGAGGNITNGGGTLTIGGVNNASTQYGGVISGSGGLTMTGAGTLTLTNTNTFTGGITIGPSNTLAISGPNAQLGTHGATGYLFTSTIVDNGTYIYAGGNIQTNSGSISGNGMVIVNSGEMVMGSSTGTGNNSFTNNLVVNGPGIVADEYAVGTTGNSGFGATGIDGRAVIINNGGIVSMDTIGGNTFGGGTVLHHLTFVVNQGGLLRTTSGNNVFTNIILNGGTVSAVPTTSIYSSAFPTYDLAAGIFVGGTSPSFITASGPGTTAAELGYSLGVNQGTGYQTPFNVGVTGSSQPDLTISATLFNSDNTASATGFVKNGLGTMALTLANVFTGPITINLGTVLLSGAGSLNSGIYAGTIVNNGTFIWASSANQTLSSVISGTGTLIVSNTAGSGLTNTGLSTYTGPTIIAAGTLYLAPLGGNGANGALNGTSGIILSNAGIFDVSQETGGYTMASSQNLLGYGHVNGSVTTSPSSTIYAGSGTGNGFGTLTFNNNLTMAAGSTLNLGVGSSGGGLNDQIVVNGTATGNSTTVHIRASTSVNLDQVTPYVLLSAPNGISGLFNPAVIFDAASAGDLGHYYITQTGTQVVLNYTSILEPIPSTVASPTSVLRNQSVLITSTVTPGQDPTGVVTVDASPLGGTITQLNLQSGNIYTNTIAISPTVLPGTYTLTVTVTAPGEQDGGGIVQVTVVASTETWAGIGGDGNFDTAANWAVEAGRPAAYAPGYVGDSLSFAGATGLSPVVDQAYTVNGLVFTNTAGNFTVTASGAGSLSLGTGGVTNYSLNPEILNVPINLTALGRETFDTSNGDLTIGGTITDANGGFTVIGHHNLILSGNSPSLGLFPNGSAAPAFSGPVTVRQGSMTVSGTLQTTNQFIVSDTTTSNGVANITGTGTLNVPWTNGGQFGGAIILATSTNAAGVLTMATGGTLTAGEQMNVGNGAGGYANFAMNGGTATLGSYLVVGFNGDKAEFDMSGGTLSILTNLMTVGAGGTNSIGVANISGGTFNSLNALGGGNPGGQGGIFVGENGNGTLIVSGTATVNAIGYSGATAVTNLTIGRTGANSSGQVDLLGGTIVTGQVTGGAGASVFNFNGGTLMAAPEQSVNPFMVGITAGIFVYSGGAFIDDGGGDIIIPQPLLVTTGYGVSGIAVQSGGSGYIAPPIITISGGSGTGAKAIAKVSGGSVSSIQVVNPGVGYAAADVLTVTIYGGGELGGNGTLAVAGTVTLTPNASGGLTKLNSGTLELSGVSTYTGATTINNGILQVDVGGSINSSTNIYIQGTTAQFNGQPIASLLGTYTFAPGQRVSGSGYVVGAATTSAGTAIYPGTDGTGGNLTFTSSLNVAGAATANFDLDTTAGSANNDLITVDGALTLNNSVIHIKALHPTMDQANPYTLFTTSGGIAGFPSSTPVFDVAPAVGAADYYVQKNGNLVQLVYSTATPPSGTGSTTPATVIRNQPFTLQVIGSAGVNSVQVDFSPIGGSLVTLTQVGNSPPTFNSVGQTIEVPAGAAPGPVTVTALVGNGSLSATVPITFTVVVSTDTWNGNDLVALGQPGWDDNNNWVSGGAPGLVGDSLIFAGPNTTANMNFNYTVNGLAFDPTAGAFTIGNNGTSLIVVNGVTNNSASVQTLSVPFIMGGTNVVIAATAGEIDLVNPVSATAPTNQLFVQGPGNVVLSGINNTYTGPTIVSNSALTIGGNGSWNNTIYPGNIVLTNGALYNFNSSSTQTNSGVISGNGALVVNGVGILWLNAENPYSGGTTVNNGVLNLGVIPAVGTGGAATGVIEGTLTINAPGVVNTLARDSIGYGVGTSVTNVTINGGTLNMAFDNIGYVANVFMTGGTVESVGATVNGINQAYFNFNTGFGITTFASPTTALFSGGIDIRGPSVGITNAVGTDPSGIDFLVTGLINNAGAIGKYGPGRAVFSATNNYTGSTTFGGGTLQANSLETANLSGPFGKSTAANPGNLVFAGGTLQFSAVNQTDYSGRFSTADAQPISIDTFGFNVSFGTALAGNGSSLTKLGTGTLTLNAAEGYTGATIVSNGILALSVNASLSSSSSVAISGGASLDTTALPSYTLGANASLTASGTAANNAAILGTGTVSLGGSPVILTYDGTGPALNVSAPTLSLNGNVFTVNTASPLAPGGPYTLVQASTAISGSGPNLVALGTAIPAGYVGLVTVSGSTVVMNINPIPTIGFSASSTQITLTWPSGNLGWILQSNSLNIGIQGDWFPVSGSSSVTTEIFNINKSTNHVFFRLIP